MSPSALELGEFSTQNIVDAAVSTMPSYSGEVLYQNSSLPHITSAFSPQSSLMGSIADTTLEDSISNSSTLLSECIIPQDLNFDPPEPFPRVVCKDASNVSRQHAYNHSTHQTLQATCPSMSATFCGSQSGLRSSMAFSSSGYRQIVPGHKNQLPGTNMFMLRVPLPAAVTKGLRVSFYFYCSFMRKKQLYKLVSLAY